MTLILTRKAFGGLGQDVDLRANPDGGGDHEHIYQVDLETGEAIVCTNPPSFRDPVEERVYASRVEPFSQEFLRERVRRAVEFASAQRGYHVEAYPELVAWLNAT